MFQSFCSKAGTSDIYAIFSTPRDNIKRNLKDMKMEIFGLPQLLEMNGIDEHCMELEPRESEVKIVVPSLAVPLYFGENHFKSWKSCAVQ